MSCSHSAVFLLDTAGPARRQRLQRGALRLLALLGCRFGLSRLRWAFRFFDSLGGRGGASRGGGFRPPGPRAWERFEEELAERLGARAPAALPGPAPRAALTHSGLKETLLDFQWDRPEIASPAKPARRSRRTGLAAPEPAEAPPEGFVNAVFLFSPCPHSRRELRQFVSGNDAPSSAGEPPTAQELAEKLLPKSVQELLVEQKITLFWVDTADWAQLLECPDHGGYWTMFEVICQMGGTILPAETLVHCLSHPRADAAPGFLGDSGFPVPPAVPWATLLPLDATLNCLFSRPAVYRSVFPQQEGTLFLSMPGGKEQESCAVILEPLAMSQRQLQCPVSIVVKGSLADWSLAQAGHLLTETWIVQSSQAEQEGCNRSLLHQLLRSLVAEGLHMITEVCLSKTGCPCTAVLSPLSEDTAVLTVLGPEKTAEIQGCSLKGDVMEDSPQNCATHLPEIVNSVLSKIDLSVEDSLASLGKEAPVPEWVQRELSLTGSWHPSVLEAWYPASNVCGASSDLMESFRLLQVPCANRRDDAHQSDVELSESLSELYQRKFSETSAAAGPGNDRKRRGVPRTPVRQKMKTMPRSLQMLNAARLNVKAQKFHPDAVPPAVNEKVPQKLSAKRLDEKVEGKAKALKISIDFQTEEELQSHLTASYQKAAAEGIPSSVCARNMIMAIKRFLKIQDAKEKEVACVGRVRSHLLKTSKMLRQQHGSQKETKVRECRLQVFLRLELCLQCPSLQSNAEEMEQLLEEVTDMLRILCLTEDPAYLTKFLEEILELYMNSIPKTLGGIYYGLGTQIPPKLASVLPSDFFSDDSMTLDSKSPGLPPSLSSVLTPGAVCTESDQLEELRTRSAKKRRNNVLTRHRSMTEAPQNLRQIEIPKVAKNPIRKESLRSYLATEKSQQMPLLQKEAVKEVTKVRRNLFNEEILSPSKRSLKKMLRSQSVSAVEGLKYKCTSEGNKDHRKLLTKRVAETPLHKQVSRRLLHKQIKGRSSDPGCDTGIVEESPEKAIYEAGLRRSPRIKQLSLNRTCSGAFYSTTQPSSRNSPHLHQGQEKESCKLQDVEGLNQHSENPPVQTPKRFFFGAVIDMCSPAVKHSPGRRRTRKDSLHLEELPLCQTPRKTPHKLAQKALNSASKLPRRSPRIVHRTPQKLEKTPGKSPAAKQPVAKCLGKYFSPPAQRVKSPSALTDSKRVHFLQVAAEDCCAALALSPPCEEPVLQTPKREGFTGLNASVLPPTDSNPAASPSPSATQERCFTELQTPRRSLRYLSKLASPVSARRQILTKEIQVQSDQLSRAPKRTPRKLEDPCSRLCTSPLNTEIPQLAVRPEPLCSSPLRESSTNTVTSCSASHAHAGEADWEPGASKPSSQKTPGITGTSLGSLLHTSKQAKCEPGSRAESLTCATLRENEDSCHDSGGNCSVESLQLPQSQVTENTSVLEKNKQMDKVSQKSPSREDLENLEDHLSPKPFAGGQEHAQNAESDCEPSVKRENCGANTCESFLSDLQTVCDDLEARTLLREEYMGLKAPSLKRRSRFSLNTSPPVQKSPPAYSLRCTADRRQREAAARMGEPQFAAKVSTPESHCKLPSASSPTYEVEIEMQASGLPKLRIKKIGSCSSLEVQPEASASKPRGGESPFSDFAMTWCSKHPGKLAAACVSPSCCRSFHSTPGKGAGQTYICQSYTPTSCASTVTSPFPLDAGVLRTPSPRQKGKTTPDAINDWPRRKRAAGSTANVSERNAADLTRGSAGIERTMRISEHYSSKVTNTLGEFELEGVCRLQDQASPGDSELRADEDSAIGTFGLKSRKRVFTCLSPEKEENHGAKRLRADRGSLDLTGFSTDEGNRSKSRTDSVLPEKPGACALKMLEQHSSLGDDDVFLLSGSTPPLKSGLSASSLLALTQSPLLSPLSARRKRLQEEEPDAVQITANQELSPFHIMAPRRHRFSRTYSRKKLLS